MSIYIGNIPYNTITDNRFNLNSYINSNVIYLNTNPDSHPNSIINFKNDYNFGLSNSQFVLNKGDKNLFDINSNKITFYNEFFIKSNFNTSNDFTIIHSNLSLNLYNHTNSFIINDSNYNQLININYNNIKFNINNSNKITINSNSIKFNENLIINSNNYLYVNIIKSTTPNLPIIIENIRYSNLDIIDNIVKSSISINNDIYYNKPSITINRYPVNCNIFEIYNSNLILNNKSKIFSINSNGFINISYNTSNIPINIELSNNYNYPLIFNYLSSNDIFTINNRGYIGIGTANPNNFLDIIIKDDYRNIINYPILNFDLNYNSNNNYRTSNLISIKFIASSNIIPIYNDYDSIIDYNTIIYNNFFYNFIKNLTIIPSSINPPIPEIRTINVINTINNDYIINYGISNIISYTADNYTTYEDILINNVNYKIKYSIRYPDFLSIDLNEIFGNVPSERFNPYITNTIINGIVNYQIEYTNYIKKITTYKPYNPNNFILKEELITIYNSIDTNDINSIIIKLKQRLYIEKAEYELTNFRDSITYIYQPPSDLIYATSNNKFTVSLSSDGKLNLGDIAPTNDYYLYINKKARTDNLECLNISSIPNKKNINFSYCNISNINKSFANSNICSYLNVKNGFFSNITISNLYIPEVNINNIISCNINFLKITNPNLIIDSDIFNSKLKMILGSGNYDSNITSNFILDINIDNSTNSKGLGIFSFYNNINPSLSLIGYSNNNYPEINMSNIYSSYSINMKHNNFNLINNNSNIIYKHNNNNNLLVLGTSNNIIFDLNPVNIPTNSTNKIVFGYPYRYLTENSIYNINNWETIFNTNQLNSTAMFNVYGNVNLSSINNTPFITCIANDKPNTLEVINVCIGSNISRNGYLFNVEGNSFFSSNIYVQSNVFAFGTIGNVSDIRIKENLTIINNPIDKIDKINGYIYKRKDTGKIESGLVAQEVLKILPEVVNMNNDYYNISYGNLSGLLVEGIKELNNRLKSIESLLLNSSNFSNNP